jgi:hypothetical protein
MSDYIDYLKQKLGPNWVLHPRTRRIVDKYGEDVVCVTAKQMREIDRAYRMQHGREYDKPRAAMYRALVNIHAHLANGDNCVAIMQELARAALVLEQETF